MDDLDLAQMIFGNSNSSGNGYAGYNSSRGTSTKSNNTTEAIALSDSKNGYVEILLDNQECEAATTFAVREGDICIVTISNNTPVVTGIVGKGDLVDEIAAATIRATTIIASTIIAGTIEADRLEAVEAYIKNLDVENLTAENLDVIKGEFMNLIAQDAKFDNLVATKAIIDTLEATKIYVEQLIAGNITVDNIKAVNAYIEALEAKDITADSIEAAQIYVKALQAEYADVKELVADIARVKDLTVEKLDARYAKIDLTNIDEACIKTAYIQDAAITNAKIADAAIDNAKIQNGAIQDANIADATITAAKIHDINADTITAGTLKTERLILVDNETGEESIIRAINAANGVAEPNGSKLQAQSIDVIDLYAFNATIGGFTIDTRSIYNGKESMTDPQSGVYIGLDGVAIGNGAVQGLEDKSPFMMYANGQFWLGGDKGHISYDPFSGDLDIDVSSLSISSSDLASTLQDMNEQFGSIEGRVASNETKIEQNANDITFAFSRIDDSLSENQDSWEELRSYIRLADGSIELGKVGNDFKTLITNTELAFKQNDINVAYINNQSLFITKAEITDTLAINNWKWEQRDNGNISFKWRT